MEVFKIRRKSDGLFSNGGTMPGFTKQGKLWKRKSDLTNHLNIVIPWRKEVYDDCELVVFEVIEREVSSQRLQEYIEEREDFKRQQEEARKAAQERRRQAARLQQYKELKQEFEPN